MMERLKTLSSLTAPSGWEDEARQYVLREARAMGISGELDRLGNVILRKRGRKPTNRPVVLAAYLDEPGFMVKEITQEGLLKFGLTGQTDPRTILGKTVRVGESGLRGIVGLRPIHLTPPEERKMMPKTGDLYLDVGAPDRAWTAGHVARGDYGVFGQELQPLGEHRILAKAMGRSVGSAVLLGLLAQELPLDVTLVFTVQRLVGSRGAYAAAAAVQPGAVIVLDVCPGADSGDSHPHLGGGPVVPRMDDGAFYDRKLLRLLQQGAQREKQTVQLWASAGDTGDGSVFVSAREGAPTGALKCPVKYQSAPAQVVDLRDIAAMERVLLGTLMEMEAESWI